MLRTQILLEPEQHKTLTEIAQREKRSLSSLIREMLDKQIQEKQNLALAQAASALLIVYQQDSELTASTSLDGEDFQVQG